ncbi:FAD dependent oxidoreductase [Methylobacterium pseudosasicola]|uniref:FAD dependent oxidoreductase n=1 Tax=Methylobacterium pseudosasicola TaxID=582667 RepID=A0A1I4MCQ7_9HYPH|nr:FAD dependent oxidoreductase [Methylobacterium pseudosasicola]
MEVLVVGTGVVGLSVGWAFALRGHAVIVAESEAAFGTGVSARSSEVIYGGMYDPSGSARARHCGDGADKLYNF